MVSPYEKISLKIPCSTVESSHCEELLRIPVDSQLIFQKHIISLCSKVNQNLVSWKEWQRIWTIDKRKVLLNLFITAQFNYSLLILMCYSRTLNNKINRIQERALIIVYKDYKSNFQELLERAFTIHERNI